MMRQLSLVFAVIALVAQAFASDLKGTYKGTWVSENEGSGDLSLSFGGDPDSLKAEVSFTNEGETIKCDVKSVKLDGSKLLLVMDYAFEGKHYEATLSGVVDGKVLSGTYKTKSLTDDSDDDAGRWKATLYNVRVGNVAANAEKLRDQDHRRLWRTGRPHVRADSRVYRYLLQRG